MMCYLPAALRAALCFFVGLLGLVLGSALHCLGWRMARGEPWANGSRSRCPACGHTLAPTDLIPLLSWLLLRGKCRYCGEKISPRYPISEALLALVFVSLLLRYDLTPQFLQLLVLACCLFTLSIVDLDSMLLPDRVLLVAFGARMAERWMFGGVGALWYSLWHGLVLGGGVLLLSLFMDRFLGKESMGGGDIKLLFLLGCYFDLPCCLLLLFLACIFGIFLALAFRAGAGTAVPFGPALSLAAWVVLLVGEDFSHWYTHFLL